MCAVQTLITNNLRRVVEVLIANERCEFPSLYLMEHSRGQLIPHLESDFPREPFHYLFLNIYIVHIFTFFKTII